MPAFHLSSMVKLRIEPESRLRPTQWGQFLLGNSGGNYPGAFDSKGLIFILELKSDARCLQLILAFPAVEKPYPRGLD